MASPLPELAPPVGRIELVMGPMFSGKSSELMRLMERFQCARLACLVIKFSRDTRYSEDMLATHDRRMMEATACARLEELGDSWKDFDVLGIDEGQFFPDVLEFAQAAADVGKIVIVAALDGTFQRRPFGAMCDLIPRAESVRKLSAVCTRCGDDAAFSRRLTFDTAVELIGGAESYVPVDRACFHRAVLPEKGPPPALHQSLKPRIEVVVGPVRSGKSSELCRRLKRFLFAHRRCLVLHHTRAEAPALGTDHPFTLQAVDALGDVDDATWRGVDVVGIDNSHMFADLLDFAEAAANAGKVVIVAALDGTYTQEPYGHVCDLVPLSESVTKLSAVCLWCRKRDAAFSRRVVPGAACDRGMATSREYQPCCRGCLDAPIPPEFASPLSGAASSSDDECATPPRLVAAACDSDVNVSMNSALSVASPGSL